MSIKICQLCAVDFTLKHFLLPLVDATRNQGWETVAVCGEGAYSASLRESGYRIVNVPIVRSANPLRHLSALGSLIRIFRRERFDVVHVHTPVAAMLGRLAARAAGVPLVIYTAHGFYFHDEMPAWKRAVFVALERLAGHLTSYLFTQSEEDSHTAVATRIMPADRVLAIGNGVDVSRFDPDRVGAAAAHRAALGIPPDAFVVGMIGRLVLEKGVAEFLDAAIQLAARFPSAYFVLVGERLPSDHAAGVAKQIEAAQRLLGHRLLLTGLRTDIPELLAVMDLFCLPSWREGMPRTIIEAMMSGKPVVATNIRGSREEVVAGQTGLLIPTRSPAELAEAIGRLIADPDLGKAMGGAGRERALSLYDERKVVDKQLQVLRGLLAARGLE